MRTQWWKPYHHLLAHAAGLLEMKGTDQCKVNVPYFSCWWLGRYGDAVAIQLRTAAVEAATVTTVPSASCWRSPELKAFNVLSHVCPWVVVLSSRSTSSSLSPHCFCRCFSFCWRRGHRTWAVVPLKRNHPVLFLSCADKHRFLAFVVSLPYQRPPLSPKATTNDPLLLNSVFLFLPVVSHLS